MAAVANTALYFVFHGMGVDFVIQPSSAVPAAPIPVPSFVVASFVPALVAGGLLLVLGRFTKKARRVFLIVACAFAALSLAGPGTTGGASPGTRVVLMVMHLVAATVITGALMHSARTREGATPPTVGR